MRCMTSGRFTPAAATFTRISPSPGFGTGRCSGDQHVGAAGSLDADCGHLGWKRGHWFLVSLCEWQTLFRRARADVTTASGGG